jgi:tetratricopeptide (TPR) repeat protein
MSQHPPALIQGMVKDALERHQAGQFAEAERIYRQILSIDPRNADCLHLLGMIAYQTGELETAAALIRSAIAIHDKGSSYYANLGTVLQAQGKPDEAEELYRQALVLNPGLAEVHVNLANVLQARGELEDSAKYYERALALKPDIAEAYNNLGNTRQRQGQIEAALDCYARALAIKPNYPEAYRNLGNALRDQGKLDEALVQYRKALAAQPGHPEAGFAEAIVQLLQGDFGVGWKHYERRWQSADHDTPRRAYAQPAWNGEKLASGSVLIWGEQGVGDEIMFAGLIPDAIRTGNRCILDCDARLIPLFARSFPDIDVVSGCGPGGHSELNIASQLPIGSLPGLFRKSIAAFDATVSSYLVPDPAAREKLHAGYADGRLLVGLAWHTNSQKTGRSRCIDLGLLAPLWTLPDIQWVNLQYGDHGELEDQAAAAGAPRVVGSTVDKFAQIDLFAAQVAAMDLVITIDNSTAHLAGALGVPVWVLLPFARDWRWLQDCENSPWYPTMRLFRQRERDNWQSVVEKVRDALLVHGQIPCQDRS